MLRLFFAVQPRAEQNAALVEASAPLIAQLRAQCVPVENLHATLCFIGAVAEEKLDALRAAADSVRGRALTLHFDRLDYWSKPGILCAVATESAIPAPAQELSKQLASVAVSAGFMPDAKPFRAHVTLARKVDASRGIECEWPRSLSPPVPVHCDRFALMRSEKGPTGSIYSVVAEWPLDTDNSR